MQKVYFLPVGWRPRDQDHTEPYTLIMCSSTLTYTFILFSQQQGQLKKCHQWHWLNSNELCLSTENVLKRQTRLPLDKHREMPLIYLLSGGFYKCINGKNVIMQFSSQESQKKMGSHINDFSKINCSCEFLRPSLLEFL